MDIFSKIGALKRTNAAAGEAIADLLSQWTALREDKRTAIVNAISNLADPGPDDRTQANHLKIAARNPVLASWIIGFAAVGLALTLAEHTHQLHDPENN